MKFLFFFIDGIGLGEDNPTSNPFAIADTPVLKNLLNGHKLVKGSAPHHNLEASLLPLDACLNVQGVPQSATGQAALLTGKNVPAIVGYHFGPWPNQAVIDTISNSNLFSKLTNAGFKASFLNAYPQSYFDGINSGRRLYSAIPQAVVSSGFSLKTTEDLKASRALSADFTAQGWHDRLNIHDIPIITPYQAGARIASLSNEYDFSFFEYWLSDYAGHHQDMEKACDLLVTIDQVFDGLINHWDEQNGVILVTSDHGNMEDLSTRRHTINKVPALLIGAPHLRRHFFKRLYKITDVAPAIYDYFQIPTEN